MSKWNSNMIIDFLELYEKYNLLWNTYNKHNMIRPLRDAAFENLRRETSALPGFEEMDTATLKNKLKTIKTVYRQELNKVMNKSGYKPKLVWYDKANSFLGQVTTLTNKESAAGVEEIDEDNNEVDPPNLKSERKSDSAPSPETGACTSVRPRKKLTIPVLKRRHETGGKPYPAPAHEAEGVPNKRDRKDEFSMFGDLIGVKVRNLPTPYERSVVQHRINTILFEAELGKFKARPHKVEPLVITGYDRAQQDSQPEDSN